MAGLIAAAACATRGERGERPDPARTAAASPIDPCADGSRRVTLERVGEALRVTPDPGLGAPRPTWQGDVNGDRRDDLLLSFPEACGNWGECPVLLYLACEDGSAREMFREQGPVYVQTIAPVEQTPPSCAPGWLAWRVANAPGSPERSEPEIRVWCMIDGAYRPRSER